MDDLMWEARHDWGDSRGQTKSGLHRAAAATVARVPDWGAHPALPVMVRSLTWAPDCAIPQLP